MNVYHFGLGSGHLPVRKTRAIAKKHGAELVNYTEPGNGYKRHWFNALNDNNRFVVAHDVLAELKAAGII